MAKEGELVAYKHKRAVIPFEERLEIVRSIQFVDVAIAQENMNKFEAWKKLKFDLMFVGDDWYQTEKWEAFERQFQEVGVRIIYFPYFKGTSSTLISQALRTLRDEPK